MSNFQTIPALTSLEYAVTAQTQDDSNSNTGMTEKALLAIIIISIIAAAIDVVGIASNLLVVRVMMSPTFAEMPRSLISLSLAFTDLVGLVLVLVSKLLAFVLQTDPQLTSRYACKGLWFVAWFIGQMDISMILLICIERVVVLSKPLHAGLIMSRSRVRAGVIVCIVLILILNVDLLFIIDIVETKNINNETYLSCQYAGYYTDLAPRYVFIKAIFNDVVTYFLPLVVAVILNIVIIMQMRRRREAAKNLGANEKVAERQLQKVTKTTLAISFALIVLLLPSTVLYLILFLNGTTHIDLQDPVHHTFVVLSTSVSWSINFPLYFLSGTMFQQEVANIFTCCRRNSEPAQMSLPYGKQKRYLDTPLQKTLSTRARSETTPSLP